MLNKILFAGKSYLWSAFKDKVTADHYLLYLFWECTLNCNFYCRHCGSNAGYGIKYEGELDTEEIKKSFKDVADNFVASDIMIAVTGGEPLLRKDVFEVMKYASSLGFRWGMVTNGFLLNEQVIAKMKDSGMNTVVVSIDGLRETHDSFRGVKGAYSRAIQAVKLLVEAGFLQNVQITTTVHPGNIDQLEEMYQEFLPLGIDSWRLMNADPIGRAENSQILLKPDQLKKLLDFIKEKRKKSKKDITYGCTGFLGEKYEEKVRKNMFFCRAGVTTGSILYNGDIFVCPNVPRVSELIQGNIRQEKFSRVWKEKFDFFRDPNKLKCDKCEKCLYWDNCRGSGLHVWDFEKGEPKMCHLDYLVVKH